MTRKLDAKTQTGKTSISRPADAPTSRLMSSVSLVRTVALLRTAIAATAASTTSAVRVNPSSLPASCASRSPKGTTSHPVKKRRSCTCCENRLTCATTGAGASGTMPNSNRALCSAHARLSFRSAATRTAASYKTALKLTAGGLIAPFRVALLLSDELLPSLLP